MAVTEELVSKSEKEMEQSETKSEDPSEVMELVETSRGDAKTEELTKENADAASKKDGDITEPDTESSKFS